MHLSAVCSSALAVKLVRTGNQTSIRTTYHPAESGDLATLLSHVEVLRPSAAKCEPLSCITDQMRDRDAGRANHRASVTGSEGGFRPYTAARAA